MKLNELVAKVREGYDSYEFHTVFHTIHKFCVVDMSNFYLDVIKDRLYCDDTTGLSRRSAQTAMYNILSALVRMLSPDPVLHCGRNLAGYAARRGGRRPQRSVQ